MIPGLIFLIIILSLVLIKSAEMVIVAIRRIAKEAHAGLFTISAIVLALGTSLPELFVGITSSLEKSSSLSLGVVLGSNIANIALVAGLSAFFMGKVNIKSDYLKREVGIALAAGTLPLVLVIDGVISRIDGFILITIYFAYAFGFFRHRFIQIGKEQQEEGFIYRFLREFKHIESIRAREFGRLFLGVAFLIFSSDAIVKLSSRLATEAHIPIFLVGLFILAIGTSLPELAFSFRSLEDHEPSMFFGNILGSIIVNATLIVGLSALIYPIKIEIGEYLTAATAFFVVFVSFWLFIRSKHRLDRWEAASLLILYFVFIIVEFV